MKIHDKLRMLREQNKLSQEEVAEQLSMSPSGYAKIERGETKLYLDKLEKIAHIFNIDVVDLINNDKNICVLISENSSSSSNYYNSDNDLILENEKLKLSLSFQEKLIDQQKTEIALLKEMNELLKNQLSSVNWYVNCFDFQRTSAIKPRSARCRRIIYHADFVHADYVGGVEQW